MSDLRDSLKKLLDSNSITTILLPAAFVLILIEPIFRFINCLHYMDLYHTIYSVLYIMYLLGLVLCFARKLDWAIGTAFGIKALAFLIDLIRYFTLNSLVYLLFYSALAVYFIRNVIIASGKFEHINVNPNFNVGNPSPSMSAGFCTGCGKPLDPTGKFCPYCGTPYNIQSMNFSQNPNDNLVVSMCGSKVALAFTILLTAKVLVDLAVGFSIIALLASIPIILICIACWLIYTGSASHQLTETGFTLMNGSMIAELVIGLVATVILDIIGIGLLSQSRDSYLGDYFLGAGIAVLLISIAITIILVLYWKGLRATVISARAIVRGQAVIWQTSLFSIVIICIGAVGQLISLAAYSSLSTYLNSLLNLFSYTSNDLDILYNYLESLNTSSSLGTVLSSLLDIAVMVFAVVFLIQIRNTNKTQTPEPMIYN